MHDKDLLGLLTVTQLLDPDTVTTDTASGYVDMLGFNSCMFVVSVGASGDTLSSSVKIELEVQEGDATNSFAAAPDTAVRTAITGTATGTFALIDAATEDDAVYTCQYVGNKRYAKVNINVTGTHTSGTPIAVLAVQGGDQIL